MPRSPFSTRSPAAGAALLFVVAACDCSGAPGAPCEVRSDCAPGEMCVDLRCVVGEDGSTGVDAGGLDASSEPRDSGMVRQEDAGPCREVSGESTVEPVPVDIIVVIDNSGSMSEEAAEVRRNINNFAGIIAASGLDYRVVLISTPTGTRGVCVDPPLGSGPPDCTSGPEGRLLALHVGVGSRNAPNIVLSEYPSYRDFLRPEAAKVFLWITDDESGTYSADELREALDMLDPPGMFERQIHNAIVGYYGDTAWSDRTAGTCGTLASVGETYLRLANCLHDDDTPVADCTPGRQARVCETDWTLIFEEIARGVVEGVPVVCDFAVPPPPEGMTLDLDMVRVTYRSSDTSSEELTRVPDADACTDDGWYFDDPVTPERIILCPDLCTRVQADPDARMDIALGCFPILM